MRKTIDCFGSSNIKEIEYESDLDELRVTYNGDSVYHYADVPLYKADELEAAASKGAYLAQNIKPHYTCTRIK